MVKIPKKNGQTAKKHKARNFTRDFILSNKNLGHKRPAAQKYLFRPVWGFNRVQQKWKLTENERFQVPATEKSKKTKKTRPGNFTSDFILLVKTFQQTNLINFLPLVRPVWDFNRGQQKWKLSENEPNHALQNGKKGSKVPSRDNFTRDFIFQVQNISTN